MRMLIATCCAFAAVAAIAVAQEAPQVEPAPNGITIPEGYQDWAVLSVASRADNDTIRVIIGNDIAIEAARAGETNPWPDGAIIGKVVWSQHALPTWETATVPNEYRAVEFMIRDEEAYADTVGWGFARWLGADRTPYGADASFTGECVGCHTPVADTDYVFTQPVMMP